MRWPLYTKNKAALLGALTFFSFLIRLFSADTRKLYPDSCLYLSFVKSILQGKFSFDFREGVEAILPPLYSISGAAFAFLLDDVEISGILISSVSGALLTLPVFYLAKALYSEKAAWISVILVILSPILVHWSGAILTESLFITLFVSGLAAGLYALEGRKRMLFIISGALIGLSYMTRVIGLTALPVMGLWILFYSVRPGAGENDGPGKSGCYDLGKISKKTLMSLVLFSLGFILVTGPYFVKLHSFFGYWTLAGGYGSIKGVIAYEGGATVSEWEKLGSETGKESFAGKLVRKVTINTENYSVALIRMLSLSTVFVIAGLFPRRKIIYIASFVLFYFSALLVQALSPLFDERIRYLSPVLPLLLVLASGGIVRIRDWIKGSVVQQAILPAAVVLVLISFFPHLGRFPIQFNKFWVEDNRVNIREIVGIWMKENLPGPIRAMSRKPYIPYYAGAVWFRTPATYDEVIKVADLNAVDYLIIERSIDFYLRPELRFLFHPEKAPANLKYVWGVRRPGTGELYIGVYRINRAIQGK